MTNALRELFSDAAVCYPEIKEAALKVVKAYWKKVVWGESIKELEEEAVTGGWKDEKVAMVFELLRMLKA